MGKPLYLVSLPQEWSIYEQLSLEEALLRVDDRSFCILKQGSSKPSIVLGISSKMEEMLHLEKLRSFQVDLIRRFSGGGTVVVDNSTFFISFIGGKDPLAVNPVPDQIHLWAKEIYAQVFEGIDFALKERDYVVGLHKIGGNAQVCAKERWLHHTSFLWDYSNELMTLLKIPPKIPDYRQARDHHAFLTTLNRYFDTRDAFFQKVEDTLKHYYEIIPLNWQNLMPLKEQTYRKSLQKLS